jgi:hypothetical protein
MALQEEHSFVEMFFNFEGALNFTLDWIEDNFDPTEQFIDRTEIVLMDSGAYRAGVILKNKQTELFGATEDA